ncbi:DNA cytosine methyltransferase [Leclercia sp. LSNIH1]|uniref:DNA cytosine methyltransferase n=1 Tax=Leclercia sp. LSNIH1 TaxID=1920114 RepID=UPI000CD26738|nr:DNA cytosine methyltransferase [Leclercia sp. LSNIH1]AUU83866.1 DNA (cytosine-5-)-methyltransferase [Leclercia sp. LSNIH1]POV32114.1 DNA (cytosine-5-)-methyltransferase [Leclercia sp. LSNIH5]POW61470.1 DNA (cytosine-5-)-methyltransferase [Leclercia sp. LSNIH2]
MSIMKPALFSFFSGSGFLDLGFENAGYEVVFVNEFHPPFMEAYKYSREKLGKEPPRFGYAQKSIENIEHSVIKHSMETLKNEGRLVGFIGGPPCPDFSIAGKNKGKDGENGKLSKSYVDMIIEMMPDFFLFENVKGLYRTLKHRAFFEQIKRELAAVGYILHERLINSIEYGAPQDRERIILVGFLNKNLAKTFNWSEQVFPNKEAFQYPWPTTNIVKENSTVECPEDIPMELTIEHWFEKNDVSNHANAKHVFTARAGLARFQSVEEGDDSKKSYKRLHRWRYSPTAAYGNNEVHLHPYKPRRITVAEALAIQSLPKNFELPENMTLSNMFKTVGNGVPYLAAFGIAKSILKHLGIKDEFNSNESCECDSKSTQKQAV